MTGVILDDHELFANGLRCLLDEILDFATLFVCSDPDSAASTIDRASADLIVTDFYIPGYCAETFLPELRRRAPNAVIAAVSATLDRADAERARALGATVFVPKSAPVDTLAQTLKDAIAGSQTADAADASPPLGELGLTPRQGDILVKVGAGLSTKEIARSLAVSPETVKTHLAQMFRACGVANRIELIRWARGRGVALA
ncbi:MAG: response regulator transcription factor [Pseudomonadota bacterium]